MMENDTELYEAIRRYAARLLSDPESAQDVAQEVFLRLEQNREEILQPRAWVYRTARNLVVDLFRKKGKMDHSDEAVDNLPAEATRFSPALLAEKKETIEMLNKKMNNLSARHREVLRLKFQEGLKYAEIAEVLELSVPTVGWLIHEAVTKLRRELGGVES